MENSCLICMMCGDPESGTDHSLKEVSACLIWHRVDTSVGHPGKLSQGCLCYLLSTFRSYIFSFTIYKHVCVKDSIA